MNSDIKAGGWTLYSFLNRGHGDFLINFTFITTKDTFGLFLLLKCFLLCMLNCFIIHEQEFLIYASYSSVFDQQWVTTLSFGLTLAIICSFRQFKTLHQLQNLWNLKCADIYGKFFVLYLVTMQPCLGLQSLQLLFNRPTCMNHEVWRPHVALFAWCLLACCESDSMSRGPLTTIMTAVA